MLKSFRRKRRLNKLEELMNIEYRQLCFWKSKLYDVEHDLLSEHRKELEIQYHGSMDAYKKHYEDLLKDSETWLHTYFDEKLELEREELA